MRLTSKQKQITWKKDSRMAFWDQPHYEYGAWRHAILNGDRRTINHSIKYMKPIDFINLVNIDYFIEHWVEWRHFCHDNKIKINTIILDALWGDYVMSNPLVVPKDIFLTLTNKQKETYNIVTQYPDPLSMYELAKIAKRHYRRIYDDINILASNNLFSKKRTKRNNRTVDLIGIKSHMTP